MRRRSEGARISEDCEGGEARGRAAGASGEGMSGSGGQTAGCKAKGCVKPRSALQSGAQRVVVLATEAGG